MILNVAVRMKKNNLTFKKNKIIAYKMNLTLIQQSYLKFLFK
jgi:hypothetical protein